MVSYYVESSSPETLDEEVKRFNAWLPGLFHIFLDNELLHKLLYSIPFTPTVGSSIFTGLRNKGDLIEHNQSRLVSKASSKDGATAGVLVVFYSAESSSVSVVYSSMPTHRSACFLFRSLGTDACTWSVLAQLYDLSMYVVL